MSTAPQSAAAPVAAAAAQHHPPPTLLQTGTPSQPNGPSRANATGRTVAQTASASPATAGAADSGVSGQTAAPTRPVVKMKRTGHQGSFPLSSSSLGSGAAPKSNLQNPANPKVAVDPSPSFSSATRNRPPSHARQSHTGLPNSVETSLTSTPRPSSSASPSPDLDPQPLSSRPEIPSAGPSPLMHRPRRRPSGGRRQTSPESSRGSSPVKSPKPKPAQQPLLSSHTPRPASNHGTPAFQIAPSPFQNSGRTAPKPEPQPEQTSVATPGGPSPAASTINPKTNKVYSLADAVDDGDYKHYRQ